MSLQLEDAGTAELLSVVYASIATGPFTDADLASLLLQSRMRNEPAGLTGMLLHRDGQFMQALEGPTAAVRATLRRIAADPRHTGVWILHEEAIPARRFGSWAMGYRDPGPGAAQPEEWFGSPEARTPEPSTAAEARVRALLDRFRER